ncbi:MAG: alpha/beta fold hydrolase [Deltaproteobacteria bacterium]|nr:alpha/beta fold hydrolase [Deltaproteobacteria bacterium]
MLEPTSCGAMALDVSFDALDGYPLRGALFVPEKTVGGAVLIAGAMGVRQRYYRGFGEFLSRRGLASLTFDYRGIGESRRGPAQGLDASMIDWAERDLGGAVRALTSRFSELPLLWVGHSLGGQLMGFVEAPVRAAVFVASQSGYWRNWSGVPRILMRAVWAMIPPMVDLVGYLPMRRLGQGEDVPSQVACDWATWGKRPQYLKQTADERGSRGYATWSGALRSYAISDDGYAPIESVEALVRLYRSAESEIRVVRPRDVGLSSIGHFGFFRPELASTLWGEAADWLLEAGVGSGGAP